MPPTAFQCALQRGLQSDEKFGPIRKAMKPLGDNFKITDAADARALADSIASMATKDPALGLGSVFSELIGLTGEVGSKTAFEILRSEAMPSLESYFDRHIASADRKGFDLAPVLRKFGFYGRREGFDRIVRAIRSDLDCEWFWVGIFGNFPPKHPLLPDLLEIPLTDYPRGFVRVALLDHVNQLAIKREITHHPFDCPEGKRQIREWLTDSDPEHFSYARSGAVALPFVSAPEQSELLALAMDHMSIDTQLEGAWASTRIGNAGGIKFLQRACTDPALFLRAARYLAELGHEHAIPEQCNDPDFKAEADARSWLAHPNEFGRQPDKIEIYDSRTLFWPPANGVRQVHLFRYIFASDEAGKPDTLGVVMTGGCSTFSLFSEASGDMSPEDIYALHCCWELQINKDPRAPEKRSTSDGRKLLNFPES